MRRLIVTLVVVASAACGHTPSRLGVVRDEVGVRRTRLGPAPPNVFERDFLPGTLTRAKTADVVGDSAPELLVEGSKSVEIRDRSGVSIRTMKTPDYLTDFGSVAAGNGAGAQLVLCTYPNAERGSTFMVFNRTLEPVATWTENPPVCRFASAQWMEQPALYYLQHETIIIRAPSGAKLEEWSAPEGRMFRDVFVQPLGNGRTAIVLSGSGYTPYHMVCVYDGKRLVFADVEKEHAYGVDRDAAGSGFVVTTRENRFAYTLK